MDISGSCKAVVVSSAQLGRFPMWELVIRTPDGADHIVHVNRQWNQGELDEQAATVERIGREIMRHNGHS